MVPCIFFAASDRHRYFQVFPDDLCLHAHVVVDDCRVDEPDIIRIPFLILFILLDRFFYPGMGKRQMVFMGSTFVYHGIIFFHARYMALHYNIVVFPVLFFCLILGKEPAETFISLLRVSPCAFLRAAEYRKNRPEAPCPPDQHYRRQDHQQ